MIIPETPSDEDEEISALPSAYEKESENGNGLTKSDPEAPRDESVAKKKEGYRFFSENTVSEIFSRSGSFTSFFSTRVVMSADALPVKDSREKSAFTLSTRNLPYEMCISFTERLRSSSMRLPVAESGMPANITSASSTETIT